MFDPSAWLAALIQAMQPLVQAALNALSSIVNNNGQNAWQGITESALNSNFNFLTRTPADLSYNLGSVADMYHQWEPALVGFGALSCLLAAFAVVGRELFAWTWHPGEWASRLFLGMLMAMACPRFYMWSIDLNNAVCDAIVHANLPSVPAATDMDPISQAVIVLVWIVLGFRLLVRMAYRIVYFDILLVVGPVAFISWVIPGGQDYMRMWLRSYLGLLLGQVMVVICLRIAAVMAGPMGGTWGGLALGIAVLLLSYDMATLFADIRGGGIGGLVSATTKAVALIV